MTRKVFIRLKPTNQPTSIQIEYEQFIINISHIFHVMKVCKFRCVWKHISCNERLGILSKTSVWGCRILQMDLCSGIIPHRPRIVLDMALNNLMVMLDLWRMWSTPSLPLLPSPLWPGMLAPDKILSIFTNPSARTGYATRSIFEWSLTGLNSEFSFS